MQGQDFANVLGNFFKLLAAVVVGGFAVVLEYAFFQSISPPDKPWFPYLAMSLTIGGFLCWMLSFRLIRHNPLHTMIAFLMMIGCAAASLVVAGTEFYSWIAEHYSITTSPLMYQNVTTMLLIIFCAHVVALIVDVSCAHFAKNPFRSGGVRLGQAVEVHNWPEVHQGDFHAVPRQRTEAQLEAELRNNPMYAAWFNWMETQRGGSASPLASHRQSNQPKEEAVNMENSAEIEVPQIEQPKPRQVKPLPQSRNSQQTGLLQEGTGVLVDGMKSLFSRRNKGN